MKSINWWVWERPSAIHIIYIAALCAMHPLKQKFSVCYAKKLYCFFKDEMIKAICDFDELISNGRKVVNGFLDSGLFNHLKDEWNKKSEKLLEETDNLRKTNIKSKTDKELLELYDHFTALYSDWWSFTQSAELFSYGGEDMLKEMLTSSQYNDYFNILVTPTGKSYANEEEEALFRIVKIARVKGIDDPEVNSLIKFHAMNYYWLQNSFGGTKNLDESYFKKIVLEHLDADVDKLKEDNEKRLDDIKKKKESILNKINADRKLRRVIEIINDICLMQDNRKSVDMRANAISDMFCEEIAARKNISFDVLKYALPEQIRDLLCGKEINPNIFEKQKKRSILIFNDENDNHEFYVGEEAIAKESEILGKEYYGGQTELIGMAASTGRYTGRVKIVLNDSDLSKINKGDVIVSTMTTPNFVSGMKKAGAIITDEGGITCHAAIVSRELGIPCVIGLKIATKMLKDNMLVEVKANHGIVKIIK